MYMDMEHGNGSGGLSAMVAQHRDYYAQLESFEEKPVSDDASCRSFRWEVARGHGVGFTEMLSLNSGPNIGLCGYQFEAPIEGDYREIGTTIKFCIMLSGSFRMSSLVNGRAETVRSGDLWFSVGGEKDEVHCFQPAGEFISGVSIGIPRSMLDHWLGGASCELSRSLDRMVEQRMRQKGFVVCGSFPKMRGVPASHPLVQVAQSLFTTERTTLYGRLMFESRALDFLSRMLTIDGSPSERVPGRRTQRQRAVEEAVGILDKEWAAPPTITALSRRVGVNECYLKTDFRVHTGLSIGEYVRKVRMEKALSLIESSRCSVLQAALFVGYSNPSHFSRAFKRFHGYLPSSCAARP
ncbi:MAG: AraC family transcriptional regulator [Pseudodesulfovibrio sp.]